MARLDAGMIEPVRDPDGLVVGPTFPTYEQARGLRKKTKMESEERAAAYRTTVGECRNHCLRSIANEFSEIVAKRAELNRITVYLHGPGDAMRLAGSHEIHYILPQAYRNVELYDLMQSLAAALREMDYSAVPQQNAGQSYYSVIVELGSLDA